MKDGTNYGKCEVCHKTRLTYEIIDGMQIGANGILDVKKKKSTMKCLHCIKKASVTEPILNGFKLASQK